MRDRKSHTKTSLVKNNKHCQQKNTEKNQTKQQQKTTKETFKTIETDIHILKYPFNQSFET